MAWEEKQVRGYPEFVQTAQRYHGRPIFALFCGDKDAEGKSWCPDCVTGEACGTSPSPLCVWGAGWGSALCSREAPAAAEAAPWRPRAQRRGDRAFYALAPRSARREAASHHPASVTGDRSGLGRVPVEALAAVAEAGSPTEVWVATGAS